MKVTDFDYYLPEELIAQKPSEQRDQSGLMVVHRASSLLEHRKFSDLIDYIHPGDILVLNKTRVIPARLTGYRKDTGSKVEIFLLQKVQGDPLVWEVLVKPGRKARPGMQLGLKTDGAGSFDLEAEVRNLTEEGSRIVEFKSSEIPQAELRDQFEGIIDRIGQTPLPPYINRPPEAEDKERYQTVYAQERGSVAAPTAGLHFTPALLNSLQEKGASIAFLTLHVGLGTFRPVKVDEVEKHKMHSEFFQISQETADMINTKRDQGGKVIAVGTTVVRSLETAADADGKVKAGEGKTDIFIYPGYRFKVVDSLLTNYHLPRSTLLMLVCALGGRDLIMRAYQEAVHRRYRFFSYGDAMLII